MKEIFKHILFSLLLLSALTLNLISQDDDIPSVPVLKFMRIYGTDSESSPPIVILKNSEYSTPIGGEAVTIELDVFSSIPPSLYAIFVHCSADWKENDNVFLNDIAGLRTSNIQWESSPSGSRYYSYRGKLQVPNEQVKFKHGGNWKVKLFNYDDESKPFAEGRFFVVGAKASCDLGFFAEFYSPDFPVSSSALSVEANVYSNKNLLENRVHTVVLYNNNRWNEPYAITNTMEYDYPKDLYRYKFPTYVGGFVSVGKRFRIERMPSQNGYRVLNLADILTYPPTTGILRQPLSDLRRRGVFFDYDDDGAMITSFISFSYDDYVYFEFQMDPEGWVTKDEVFVVGSFNNWKPSSDWQMYYDEDQRLYKLRTFIRRGRHNYLYATGKYDNDTKQVRNISYDEFEGNTSSHGHKYIALVYYKELEYGGYDSIIAVGAGSIYGTLRR